MSKSVTLNNHLLLIQEFRKRYQTITATTVIAFLYIVEQTYLRKTKARVHDIGEALGLTSASMSRNLAILFDPHKGGRLLEYYENPERRTEKFIYLSKAGEKFAEHLLKTQRRTNDNLNEE